MRVIVTGGSGKLGRTVVADLIAHGHQVFNLDSQPPPVRQGVFLRVDLTDYGQVLDVLTGVDQTLDRVDAVVHLAAIPAPGLTSNVRTATNNITATYHVFAGCQKASIRRIVWASSETVLGVPFDSEFPPAYVPIDEEVSRPRAHYAVVKTLEGKDLAQHLQV